MEFASALGWVDEQLLVWKESGAECYVEQLENALVAAMNDDAIPSRFASHHPDANQYFMYKQPPTPCRLDSIPC